MQKKLLIVKIINSVNLNKKLIFNKEDKTNNIPTVPPYTVRDPIVVAYLGNSSLRPPPETIKLRGSTNT